GTPGLDVVRSRSVNALSQIVLLFKRGTDLLQARQLVQERLQQAGAQLPGGMGPPGMLQPLSRASRGLEIGISSQEMSLLDLSRTTYWRVRFRWLRVPVVANVPIWGERLKQLQIQVDPERMRVHDVSLNDVMEAASGALDFGLLLHTPAAKTQ